MDSSGSQQPIGSPPNDDNKKPVVKTLNRVPRACTQCRKQKMRCMDAENGPPCKRCRHAGLTCEFQAPSRESNLTGEAGLERIRSLEAQVSEVQNTLLEILHMMRGGPPPNPAFQPLRPSGEYVYNGPPPVMVGPDGATIMHAAPPQNPYPPTSTSNTRKQEFHPPPPPNHYPVQGPSNHVLPPFSSIQTQTMGPGGPAPARYPHPPSEPKKTTTSTKRPAQSNLTSADNSDSDGDDFLVAPWEHLRGLADVAEYGRARSISPDRQSRPSKRRKTKHKVPQGATYPDVVERGIVSDADARELFRIFYHGCSTFLPIFDSTTDTYEALRARSPFAVDCICMVAARVRDGGGEPSETYLKCLHEVQNISCATLFTPVTRQEAVQAMILVSGWSDNGWLSGGHAVRMAMELSMHKAWPKLLLKINANKATDSPEDRELVIASRTWFCLYLFEHQLSYGSGRPAVLKDDESIWHCRTLLSHPLSIEDDMRLVSTVELMAIRERVTNNLSPFDRPVDELTIRVLHEADGEFKNWYETWDQAFSRKYENGAFYRQSLQIQRLHAELYHNAAALRGINGPADVQAMPKSRRDLAIRSIEIGRLGLDVTVNSPAYREGMKYAVHYTHATATFAASFLLRLSRLFPNDCDVSDIRHRVEQLAALMVDVPGKRYALTLQLMLKRSKKRQAATSRSPTFTRDSHMSSIDGSSSAPTAPRSVAGVTYSPTYNQPFEQHQSGSSGSHPQRSADAVNLDQIWRGFESTSNEQLPMWLSDQSLGGSSLSQNGMDSFLLPPQYVDAQPQQSW